MSGRRLRAKIPVHKILTQEELGVEQRLVPGEDGFEEVVFFDLGTNAQLPTPDILAKANAGTPDSSSVIIYDFDLEVFCSVSTGDIQHFKLRQSSTDYIKDGVIIKGSYMIPSKAWFGSGSN